MARSFVQLSLDERRIISRMHEKKISQAEIARNAPPRPVDDLPGAATEFLARPRSSDRRRILARHSAWNGI